MDIDRPPDIVVIAGGEPVTCGSVADGDARVIAADSGVEQALAMGLTVDLAVGDFDSLGPDLVDRLDDIAGEVRRFPADKDATDLDLALQVAAESAPARVLVAGIEGGRPDHTLAAMMLVGSRRFGQLEIELALAAGRGWVVHRNLAGGMGEGALVSIVPVHGAATVSVDGVRWPLDRAVLEPGTTYAVSNEGVGADFELTVHDGTVICITPDPDREDHS